MTKSVNIKIGGEAGEGIKVSGLTLGKSLTRLGFYVMAYSEYPSLIRGGHNNYLLHVSSEEVYGVEQKVDLLLALNKETVKLNQKYLRDKSLVLFDPSEFKLKKSETKGKLIGIEFLKLCEEAGAPKVMANMAGLGAVLGLLGLPILTLDELIKEAFLRKGEKVVELNKLVAKKGLMEAREKYGKEIIGLKSGKDKKKKMVLTGNEAIALGAVSGGLKFFSAYPMTPASSILHTLAKWEEKAEIGVKHTEDEISAVNMALGASFSGARSMTATSGGGLCLMAEGISFS